MATESTLTSVAERLTEQFYAWEKPGRGWPVYDGPIRPEPPFEPFDTHYISEPHRIDDGRRPGVFNHIFQSVGSFFTNKPPTTQIKAQPVPPRHMIPVEAPDQEWVELVIQLPADATPDMETFEQFLVTLGGCHGLICFEIIGTAQGIILQFAVDSADTEQVTGQLEAYFPEAVVHQRGFGLREAWPKYCTDTSLIVDFGLSREFMLPLLGHSDIQVDPYVSLITALSHLQTGEVAIFQVLLEPVRHAWAQSMLRAVSCPDGSPFFDNDPEFLGQAKIKIGKPLYAAVVRIAVVSVDEDRRWGIAGALTAGLDQLANPVGNELIPLSNDGYDDAEHASGVLHRQSRRGGMILNSEELASLVHLPTEEVRSRKLERVNGKTKPAPPAIVGHSLVLGTNVHNNRSSTVSLNTEQRVRHMHVIGASGTGKSTFLLNLILQDIEQGNGVGVIDPHGDLIDQILARIRESRIKDVVLVDPSDEQFPIGFNILSAHSDLEKNLLASDLVAVFRRFSTSWGDQMGSVLSNAVLAFLESSKGGTLSDLRRFLIEPAFRTEFLTTVQDDYVLYYWKKEFPLLSGRPQAPLLTRLDTFLRPKPVRYMVSQQVNRLDFATIMDSGKIFLAKLAQGAIGEENASLLGSLFVSKFHQLALGRQSQNEHSRRYFYLYCDEFGGYVTPSMAKLLAGARKFRLGLVLSHQELQQLHDEDVKSALISNAGTRICFRVGDADAKMLADGFATFGAEDLRNLGTGEAIGRVGRSDDDFNLKTEMTTEVAAEVADANRSAIIEHTRKTYATPRSEVEAAAARDRGDLPQVATAAVATPQNVLDQATPPATQIQEEAAARSAELSESLEPQASQIPQPVAPTTKPKKPKPPPPEVAAMGKGGVKHKYFQHFIAQMGQGLGYKATIEMPVPNGGGSIDVVLERPDRKIACEISVTTPVEQEWANLKKCLEFGSTAVLMLNTESKDLNVLKERAEKELKKPDLDKIRFIEAHTPMHVEELLEVLGTTLEGTVAGYKVKVTRKSLSDADAGDRKRKISKVLSNERSHFNP